MRLVPASAAIASAAVRAKADVVEINASVVDTAA
jgi:hypothetical protein